MIKQIYKLRNSFLLTIASVFVFDLITCDVYSSSLNNQINYDINDRYSIDEQLNLTYDIKSLGLKIAKLDFEVNFNKAQYFSNTVIETQGIGDFFSSSIWTFSARGVLKNDNIQPKFYNNHIETKKGVGHVSIVYNNGKQNILTRPILSEEKYKTLMNNIDNDVIDPISTLLEISMYHPKDICTGYWEITDGRRIFSIEFDKSKIDDSNLCYVTYKPLIGFTDKEMEKHRNAPTPPFQVNFVKITLKDKYVFLIPKSLSTTEGASGSIDLTSIKINGEFVNLN
tara:strand:- start:19628 stop:20476 length:849 start_codon:yes stop_codon:yes gene_type:complete